MTFQQLVRRTRKISKNDKTNYTRSPKMNGNPQRRVVVQIAGVTKPKKPNSAIRKIIKGKIPKDGNWLRATIPGIGHHLKQFDNVLIRAGRSRDLPGMHYKVIRGPLSFILPENTQRMKGKSKYGVRRYKSHNKIVVSKNTRQRLYNMGYRVKDQSLIYKGDYEMEKGGWTKPVNKGKIVTPDIVRNSFKDYFKKLKERGPVTFL